MGSSFRLFRIFGIDIRVHVTFVLLPLFFTIVYYRDHGAEVALRALVLVILVFICVLAHELCHSVQALRFGIRVPQIMLYPIGGVASLQGVPREPRKEFLISIVGPLFNFALAGLLFFPLYFLMGRENLFSPSLESWPRTFANIFWINPVLGIFNLLPAFPMDGGRVLRSLLTPRTGYLRATQICVYVGHLFAILFVLLGIWHRHWMLVLIGFFIYLSASNERRQVVYEEALTKNNLQKKHESEQPSD